MTTATITPAEFEKAVRLACMQRAVRDPAHPMMLAFTFGDEFAVRYGPFLVDIAKVASVSIPMARRRMKILQDDGRVIRDDVAGGRTRWWLAGLSAELRPTPAIAAVPAPAAPPVRQGVTAPVRRQHWSDVLGLARDCSTREATRAYRDELARLSDRLVEQNDPDAVTDIQRLKDAYSACCREHEIQIQE